MDGKMKLFTLVLMVVAAFQLSCAEVSLGKDAVAISDNPQLFLDDYLIEKMSGLTRIMNQPKKHPSNPVLVRTLPWEKRVVEIYGTVLFDPEFGKYRCWYLANEYRNGIPDTPEYPQTAEYHMCYAESKDGLKWDKPLVGSEPFGRHPKHNIVIPGGHGWCVLPTPDDPDPNKKYKGAGGRNFGFSPDGIKWDLHDWNDAVNKNDTSTSIVKWKDEYLAFVRYQVRDDVNWPGAVMRSVGLSTSKDFMNWTPKELIFKTDTKDGYPLVQPYGLAVTPYGDVLIGLLWVLYLDKTEGEVNNRLGYEDLQLIVSRDGRNWQRVADRAIFLGPTAGTWDEGRIHGPATSMIVKDDKVQVYYSASDARHGEGWGNTGIGLATLPADRFVALQPKDIAEPGILQTVPLTFTGDHLLVNAELGSTDDITAELIDKDGNVISNFAKDKAIVTKSDDLRYEIHWYKDRLKGRTWIMNNVEQPAAIRFILKKGSLYSFKIVK